MAYIAVVKKTPETYVYIASGSYENINHAYYAGISIRSRVYAGKAWINLIEVNKNGNLRRVDLDAMEG